MAASTSSGTLPPQFGAVSERATADTRPHAGNGSAEPCSPTTATFARLKGRAAQATQRPSITWCRALRRHTCSGSPRTSSPPARAATTATEAASRPRTHGRRSSACAPSSKHRSSRSNSWPRDSLATKTSPHLAALGEIPADESGQHLVDLAARRRPGRSHRPFGGACEVVAGALAVREEGEHGVLGRRELVPARHDHRQ
jgi:hypothetical protein